MIRALVLGIALYFVFRFIARKVFTSVVEEGKRRMGIDDETIRAARRQAGEAEPLVEAVCKLNIPQGEAIEFRALDGRTLYLCKEECKEKCLN